MNDLDYPLFMETSEASVERDAVLPPDVSLTNSAQISSSFPAQPFKLIGWGSCGLVYTQRGANAVVKLAKQGHIKDLENDSNMHQLISNHFKKYNVKDVQVPEWISFDKNEQRLDYFDRNPTLKQAAEKNCDIPTSTLVTERIHPMPRIVQTLLIRQYCHESVTLEALQSEGNKDCLVRIYLGSIRRYAGPSFSRIFNLRNFPIHVNQLKSLGVNRDSTARGIGQAMAIMHWAAKTDARDVEFVLGKTHRSKMDSVALHIDFPAMCDYKFSIRLWVLDFDQVQPITMDDAGVAKAVEAAKLNDPYIPRYPGVNNRLYSETEKHVWMAFVESYLFQSRAILGDDISLPRKFIYGLTIDKNT